MGQTQGHELPFTVEGKFAGLSGKSVWSVHSGTRKVSGAFINYCDGTHSDTLSAWLMMHCQFTHAVK